MKNLLRVTALPLIFAIMPLAVIACGDGPDPITMPVAPATMEAAPGSSQIGPASQDFDPAALCAQSQEENFQVIIEFDREIVTTDGYTVLGFLFGSCGPWGGLEAFRQAYEPTLDSIAYEMVDGQARSGQQMSDLIPDRLVASGVRFGSGQHWSWLLTESGTIY